MRRGDSQSARHMIYFASDFHLGAPYIADRKAHEARIVRWLDSIEADCEALYILGDIFDYWFEYRTVIPRGFVRFQAKIAQMVDRGADVHFFTGNHDVWMFDYLPAELGVKVHSGPITVSHSGKTFFIGHGDDIGYDRWYHILMWAFHNKFLQACYRWVHPALAGWVATTWSHKSRMGHYADERKKGRKPVEPDKEFQVLYARRLVAQGSVADYFVFGHRHEVIDAEAGPGGRRVLVIGDWIRNFTYAAFDGNDIKILTDDDARVR